MGNSAGILTPFIDVICKIDVIVKMEAAIGENPVRWHMHIYGFEMLSNEMTTTFLEKKRIKLRL